MSASDFYILFLYGAVPLILFILAMIAGLFLGD